MTNDRLSKAYLQKADIRIQALDFMHSKGGYSDVIRESQECVELLLKALLRHLGLEVPKIHDVSRILRQHKAQLSEVIVAHLDEIVEISRSLRKERELAFYGTEDWIPTEEYDANDSTLAIQKVKKIFSWVSQVLA